MQARYSDTYRTIAPGLPPAALLDVLGPGVALLDEGLGLRYANRSLMSLLDISAPAPGEPLERLLALSTAQANEVHQTLATTGLWQSLLRERKRALKVVIQTLPHSEQDTWLLTVSDYSEELREIQELEQAKTLAERTDRAKSEFLSHMSHELRTPLNAILGFTQLLRISGSLDALQSDNVDEIEKAGQDLLVLINEILDLSRIEAGQLKLNQATLDLRSLARECTTLIEPLATRHNVSLQRRVAGDCLLHLDRIRVKQILLHLLSNAIRYNRPDGDVVLYCHATAHDTVRVECQDSGPGIADAQLPGIFTPFQRLAGGDEPAGSTGMGLVITRRLVRLMEGEIGVFSLPERGSVFWIEFPRRNPGRLDALIKRLPTGRADAQPCRQLGWYGTCAETVAALSRLLTLRPRWELKILDTADACQQWMQDPQAGLLLCPASLPAQDRPRCAGENSLKPVPVVVVKGYQESEISPQDAAGEYVHGNVPALLALLDRHLPPC